jgi:hypothetical protein
MTIPYNSSARSMKKYVVDSLVLIENLSDGKNNWYSDKENNTTTIINDQDV